MYIFDSVNRALKSFSILKCNHEQNHSAIRIVNTICYYKLTNNFIIFDANKNLYKNNLMLTRILNPRVIYREKIFYYCIILKEKI